MNWVIGFVTPVHTSIIREELLLAQFNSQLWNNHYHERCADSTLNSNYHTLRWNYSNAIADSAALVNCS